MKNGLHYEVGKWEEVFDEKTGDFLGYTEMVSRREYNHYDQDGNFLGSTEDGVFNFREKYYEDNEDESSA